MRLGPVKSTGPRGAAMAFLIRALPIRQRRQAIDALRGHLGAFGRTVRQVRREPGLDARAKVAPQPFPDRLEPGRPAR